MKIKFISYLKLIILYKIINLIFIGCTTGQLTSDSEKYLNWCLDSKHHKAKPGPEGLLYGECTPWKQKACCTQNTTVELHQNQPSLYNFNYDHCQGKKMSSACKRRFIQDHCFYECSPNVGPWVVQESRSWRKERFYKVPLCASDCQAWFNDCRDDYTCTDNWSKNFDWVTPKECSAGQTCKTNICPSGARCQTFQEIYRTAENFCQRVWDDAWEYTPKSSPCMRIWFNGSVQNPNERVAEWKLRNLPVSAKTGRIKENGLVFIIAWFAGSFSQWLMM